MDVRQMGEFVEENSVDFLEQFSHPLGYPLEGFLDEPPLLVREVVFPVDLPQARRIHAHWRSVRYIPLQVLISRIEAEWVFAEEPAGCASYQRTNSACSALASSPISPRASPVTP